MGMSVDDATTKDVCRTVGLGSEAYRGATVVFKILHFWRYQLAIIWTLPLI